MNCDDICLIMSPLWLLFHGVVSLIGASDYTHDDSIFQEIVCSSGKARPDAAGASAIDHCCDVGDSCFELVWDRNVFHKKGRSWFLVWGPAEGAGLKHRSILQ